MAGAMHRAVNVLALALWPVSLAAAYWVLGYSPRDLVALALSAWFIGRNL